MRCCDRSPAPQKSDEQGNYDTQDNTGSNRKIKGKVISLDVDVTGQPAEPIDHRYRSPAPEQQPKDSEDQPD
jgi:hypothetical protein